ncbi:TPA: glycoside hydrolase family 99-like domain-containing protein [Clostridioides difficile]|uniref:glycoside hydrolase family 99-like domain-containing protein n=2 Tax=Clostridioides difficile TaxID=1496 RepID=UPI0003044DE7|nr:glycoside hydrolase family 99-like domain-containing protein [Clostridioides difficile]EKJ1397297.1 glycoside hydrolase family 99-like domain-containing protein [Clostridioides difficile]MDI3115913.1 glycoside hydrolase family 99-like domain-containing protein [Clostridioides difficile]MDK3179551.1 glycoside hydrolase family 99-like domain-containing protein [Clostridioides difficile]MDV9592710.1 glycoside hydrolase family 99-like domain-containing protein [Clostridioides difficile]SJT24884
MNRNINLEQEALSILKEYEYNFYDENVDFTSIIILVDDKLNYFDLCIEGIRKFTPKETYEMIIIDNRASCDTEEIKLENDLKIIRNIYNLGVSKLLNQGIKEAKGNNIIFLNGNVIVTPNWLNNLSRALHSSSDIGAVGAITNKSTVKFKAKNEILDFEFITNREATISNKDLNYSNLSEMLEFSMVHNLTNENLWDYQVNLDGFCLMIKKSIIDEIGVFDNLFTLEKHLYDDISLRILVEGYKLVLCKDTFVYSFNKDYCSLDYYEYSKLYKDNSDRLSFKWGYDINYSSLTRYEIIDMIKSHEKESIKVLEIGCGVGATLIEIKNRYKKAQIYGIEIDKNSGYICSKIFNKSIGNIEKMEELEYQDNFFDYIIFADVLEHLKSPWDVLLKVKRYLKNDGNILISLPNIMNISVIEEIINGSFSYKQAGILDKTHIRFFTLNEMYKLFSDTGYKIEQVKYNLLSLTNEKLDLINKLKSMASVEINEEFSAYQYILRVSKDEKNIERNIEKYTAYVDYLHNKDKDNLLYKEYLEEDYKFEPKDSKIIAYYLPQFHLNKENNMWWGRGSTEWDNVVKAVPQYTGHYQPRLPIDMGFYNLEMVSALQRQIELAKSSGIYGFSIYYYLSGETKLLRKPLDILLEHKELDIPFCLYWANEDWTKGYKSKSKEILIKQFISEEEYKMAIYDMAKYLKDERYITINNKKLIMIYRPLSIINAKKVIEYWRNYCRLNGIGEIYVMGTKSDNPTIDDVSYYSKCGFDGVNQFSPMTDVRSFNNISEKIDFISNDYLGTVFDYKEYVEKRKYINMDYYKTYKCVCPGWDNTPRKGKEGWIFEGYSPELYYKWISDTMLMNKKSHYLDEDIVFVNAWNEWGEGAILEPCTKYGYAYLNANKKAILDLRRRF